MAVKLQEIHSILASMETGWSWQFSSAPLPGQGRIKVTVAKISDPSRTRVINISTVVIEELSARRLAENLVRLLPTLPESSADSRDVAMTAGTTTMPHANYEMLRKVYRSNLQDLKLASVQGSVAKPQTSNTVDESSMTRFFGKFAKRFVVIGL